MNSYEWYERRLDRTACDFDPPDEPEQSAIAVHDDPSQQDREVPAEVSPTGPSVTWVRVSELPTAVGSPAVRRGIDLQAELARRTRRAPRVAVSKTRAAMANLHAARVEAPGRDDVMDRGWSL